MIKFDTPDTKSALQAKFDAQKIAFGPVVFQAVVTMRDLGILGCLHGGRRGGISAEAIAEQLELSRYGVKTLLEMGLSAEVVRKEEERYFLTKTGFFLLNDELTRVNIDFVNDVCYQGMAYLKDAITDNKPAGLKVFGDWHTIYEGLASLPDKVQDSWFRFDHFYSDLAFPKVLPLIFTRPVKKLLDVGGNTGKWAMSCVKYDPDVQVTIVDLPGQLASARHNVEQAGLAERIRYHNTNLLDANAVLPMDADAIWMSQFLDCFSEDEIVSILHRAAQAMHPDCSLYILETYWDRQRFEAGAFSLHATSLYFTCMANGNSKMYHSDEMRACIARAGLQVVAQVDEIGIGHTLMECRLSSAPG